MYKKTTGCVYIGRAVSTQGPVSVGKLNTGLYFSVFIRLSGTLQRQPRDLAATEEYIQSYFHCGLKKKKKKSAP